MARDALFLQKIIKLVGHEFAAVDGLKHLNLQLGLFFQLRLELLELVKALALALDCIEPKLP